MSRGHLPIGPADRLLLLGHGGTTDKRADYIKQVASLAVGHGMEAVAIDGPGHGDRTLPGLTPGPDSFFEVWNQGGGTDGIVADWRATLDFVESQHGARPAGWWGLSMGTMMGLPVTVADDRITVAVLGLMGRWGPNGDDLMRLAPEIGCPLRFLVQWDDEIVPRAACLELFDALGSARKTLHANPGCPRRRPCRRGGGIGRVPRPVSRLSRTCGAGPHRVRGESFGCIELAGTLRVPDEHRPSNTTRTPFPSHRGRILRFLTGAAVLVRPRRQKRRSTFQWDYPR